MLGCQSKFLSTLVQILSTRDLTKRIIMRVVSVHIIQKPNRIDALRPHRPTKAKLNARADKRNANETTNGGGLEWSRINTHYSNAHSVWMDATRIITHHNAHS